MARWLGPDPDSSLDDVEGLAILVGDQVARTPKRSIERHPDVFGAPARDLVDIEAYRQAWTEAHGRFSLNVVSTRGCPYHCNWCAKRLGAHGIRACFFIQFGYPGETWTDIEETIELVGELLPDDIGVSVSYPLPGTRFHEMVRLDLDEQANWESSGDLAMMFEGTYPTDIYRELHLSLHDDLDLRRREAGMSRCRHTMIEDVELDEQRVRVEQRWETLHQRERAARNPNPTRLRIPVSVLQHS